MRRRQLLAALAAGTAAVAGCSSDGGTGGDVDPDDADPWVGGTDTATPSMPDDTATAEDDPDDDPSDVSLGEASIVDLSTGDRTLALVPPTYRSDDGAAVTVRFAASATAEGPALVRATLTNDNDFGNTFRLRETPPFGPEHALVSDDPDGGTGPARHLVPTPGHELVGDGVAVERGPAGFWRLQGEHSPDGPERVELAPGESVTGEFALVGPADAEGFPLGRYEQGHRDAALRITAWRTSAPGPTTQSAFEGVSVPPLPEADATAWYHEADAGTEAYLRPARERATLPVDMPVTLVNHGRESVTGAHHTLYKLVDGEWFDVGPRMFTSILRFVTPGGRREFRLRASDCGDCPDDVLALGGGRYAVEALYGFDDDSDATAATAALVDLQGDRLDIAPTPGATVERDGATVRVTAPTEADRERATLTVRRAGDDAGADRVVAEQLYRRWYSALRDGIAPFHAGPDTDRVVVDTAAHAVDSAFGLGNETGSRTVRFRGETFAAVRGDATT